MARKSVKAEGGPIGAAARLRMPYARLLVPEEDGSYRAEILEFPGCIAVGDDEAEALSELHAVAEDWIDAAMEMGTPIPPPLEETDYSGKLNLRLPKSLHRKASLAADFDSVSLNQLIVTALAEYVGQRAAVQRPQGPFVIQMTPGWRQQATFGSEPQLFRNIQSFETKTTTLQELIPYAGR
jgi:predicted RNase H-like HicB family nuclease